MPILAKNSRILANFKTWCDGDVTCRVNARGMTKITLLERESTNAIIGAFLEVYNTLGYGFLENVYSLALERELLARERAVGREVPIPILYKGDFLTYHRADLIVDEKVIVEIKSTVVMPPFTKRQVTNYLRATKLEVALILHFGPEAKFYRVVCSNA
jgi:GxxExxY protein